jgi:polar amino acid transport system ATP-binding protein
VTEALDTIRRLAEEGTIMLIVSHKMGFIREISARVAFMVEGRIVELGTPANTFDNPGKEHSHDSVGKILRY